jgi:phosphatidylinositol alpha-1,6-mannosyltransferase
MALPAPAARGRDCHTGAAGPVVTGASRSIGARSPRSTAETAGRAVAAEPVLFFSFNYPPHDGGVARLCAELVSGLQRRGIGVRVLSQRRDEALSHVPAATEQRVTMRRPWRELAALRRLRAAGHRRAVICGLWYPEGLLATLAGVRQLVILAHGLELRPTRERWRRRGWRWLMGWVLRRARIVVANSNYTANLASRLAPGAHVTALPLGVDHRRFCPGDPQSARLRLGIPDGKRVIVTVARLLAHKGHRLVFTALASLPESVRAQLVYLIAGRGRDMAALQQEAEALGLGRVVRWLGYVPEAGLPAVYRGADLFVLCAREEPLQPEVEGFGLAFLEAQACGTPVVGTRAGGIPDAVVEGRGGWLIDQDDVAALTAILVHLVEEPEEFRRMGRLARQRVEGDCTWDRYVDRLIGTLHARGVSICAPRLSQEALRTSGNGCSTAAAADAVGARMVTSPQISVICTAKNAATTIAATIDSVLAQDFQDWEMIIVDDGSLDDTARIVRGFAAGDARIRLLATTGIGRGAALNRAIAEARADLIANLDADDESHPARLRCQLAAMQHYPQFPLMFAEMIPIHGAARPLWPGVAADAPLPVKDVTAGLTLCNPVPHSSALMRKSALVGLGGYDEARRFVFDYDLWVRAAAAGLRLGRVELPLVAKRLHPAQAYLHSSRWRYLLASAEVQWRASRALPAGRGRGLLIVLRVLWGILPLPARLGLRKLRGSIGDFRSKMAAWR